MAGAGEDADPGHDLDIVAIHQTHRVPRVAADQLQQVVRVGSTAAAPVLPGGTGVVGELGPLDPDRRLREKVDPAHVIPVGVADDQVGDVLRFDARQPHRLVRREEIGYGEALEPDRPMKPGVEEDDAAAALDEPEDHGDVGLLLLRRTPHENRDREVANRGVADGLDLIVGYLPFQAGCVAHEGKREDDKRRSAHTANAPFRVPRSATRRRSPYHPPGTAPRAG